MNALFNSLEENQMPLNNDLVPNKFHEKITKSNACYHLIDDTRDIICDQIVKHNT